MAIYWPTPGFKGRTFKLCVLTGWDFNFCVRSSPLRGDRKNRVRKRRVVGRIYGMKYSWKGHKERNRHKNRIKRSGQARLVYVFDINQPSLPNPFYSGLVSVFVFLALSAVFHSINSRDNSPLFECVLPVLFPAFLVLSTIWWLFWWWPFPRVRGFWENVRQSIPRLRFFF